MAQASYSALATLRNSSTFIDRVGFAVAFYARYLLGQASSAPTPSNKVEWARNAYQNPQGVASGLLTIVALDGTISDEAVLGNATDAQMQSATEAAVNSLFDNFIA